MAYPYANLEADKADSDVMAADHPPVHNAIADALNDLKTELGTTPKGVAASASVRLNNIEAAATAETAARIAADAGLQPLDSDLTAIAALATTSYGRAFLALADAAAGRTALGLGTAATQAIGAFDAAGLAAAAQAASQPLDSDLTSIAALTTTSFGRAFLALVDAAAARTAIGVDPAGTHPNLAAHDALGLATQAELDAAVISGGFIPDTGVGALTRTARYAGAPPGDFDPLVPDLNRAYYIPFRVTRSGTIDRLAVSLTQAAASSVVRLGIMSDHATPHFPGSLLVDGATVATASGQGLKEVTISQAVTPGLYWRVVVAQTASPILRASGYFADQVSQSSITGESPVAYYQDSVSGALPASATVAGTVSLAPVVYVRFV